MSRMTRALAAMAPAVALACYHLAPTPPAGLVGSARLDAERLAAGDIELGRTRDLPPGPPRSMATGDPSAVAMTIEQMCATFPSIDPRPMDAARRTQ